ncbi:MAG: HYR domain-containing protein [Verrucomicrobia bacterium]|nr:MAG: HYR domain-containing protein [Verrucomicrobiota bacterium]
MKTWACLCGLALLGTIQAQTQELDFGDAPSPYPTTLKDNGARHEPSREFFLGKLVDWESDGQPDSGALGDDKNPVGAADDEDGVIFRTVPLPAGGTGIVDVLASTTGFLDAWIDFNRDQKWDPRTETIAASLRLNAGANRVTFTVPSAVPGGLTAARFRFSSKGDLQPTGPALDGEVEDYLVELGQGQGEQLDFGDAPETYQTTLKSDGPRHTWGDGVWLGRGVDFESDGQPSTDALGDDKNPAGAADDEDGVTFLSALTPGQTVTIQVEAGTSCLLDAWVDFGHDGSFAQEEDRIFRAKPLGGGPNTLTFTVPTTAEAGQTYARFRVSLKGALDFFGFGGEGEVEDYTVEISQTGDFGDAPPPYPTTLADDGARHRIDPKVFLGSLVDAEPDGQPDPTATGDDLNPSTSPSDEDGVVSATELYPGADVTVEIQASVRGILNGWLDFGADGSWDQPEDYIFDNVPLSPGINTLVFHVPETATPGVTFARLRFNLQGGLSYKGPADDGEVEDYMVEITQPPAPCERTNKGTDFWVAFPGNYAPDPDNPVKPSLCVVGPAETIVGVQIPGLDWQEARMIDASQHAVFDLPPEVDLGDSIDEITNKGIHIIATREVAVFGLSRVRYTTDGFLALPSDVIGKNYIVQAFGNTHTGVPSLNGTQFAIVATRDNTTVTLMPLVETAGHPANTPYQVVLNQGETYQLRNTGDAPNDLSAALIAADQPIGVFAGHQCANVPDEDVWFCDYLVEQLVPVERADHEFVTMPLATRDGDTFRFFGVQPGSQVFVNGAHVATIGPGEFHEMQIKDPAHIVAEGAILVDQYANSSDADLVTISDPFQLVVPPVSMWRTEYEICVPDAGFDKNYINVVVPKGGEGRVTLDGAAIPASSYVAISGGAYWGAQVPVDPGVHFLDTTAAGTSGIPLPFGVAVYGWAEYDSYGFPGGMFFPDRTPPTLYCPEEPIVIPLSSGLTAACSAVVPDLRQFVDFTDNCPLSDNTIVTQDPPPQTPIGAGEHTVTLSVTDASGNTGSCTVTILVVDTSTPVIDCPADRTVPCTSGKGAVVEFDVPALTICGTPLEAVCDPPSGSVFPPGTTTVTCTAINDAGEAATCSFTVTVTCFGISLNRATKEIVISNIKGTLQTATSLLGPWTDVPVNGDTYVAPATDRQRFFRLKQ